MLRRLSVFSGGFGLEAAEAVCPGNGIKRHDVLHLLARLVDQSLVVCRDQGTGTRYHLLQTVRHFAADRLRDAGEEAAARAAHTGWCLALAEQAEHGLIGRDQATWLRVDRPSSLGTHPPTPPGNFSSLSSS